MYTRIITITMKHSRKRKKFRLSISPTSPHREVANRLLNSAHFRRIAPVASCEVAFILHIVLCFVKLFHASQNHRAKTRILRLRPMVLWGI